MRTEVVHTLEETSRLSFRTVNDRVYDSDFSAKTNDAIQIALLGIQTLVQNFIFERTSSNDKDSIPHRQIIEI